MEMRHFVQDLITPMGKKIDGIDDRNWHFLSLFISANGNIENHTPAFFNTATYYSLTKPLIALYNFIWERLLSLDWVYGQIFFLQLF